MSGPSDTLAETYLRMLDTICVKRAVLMQGSGHGTDNRAVAIAVSSAPGRLRGVAVIGPESPRAEAHALHAQGLQRLTCGSVVATALQKINPVGAHKIDAAMFLCDAA